MLSIRVITAVFLLLSYSVGMAHDFIPHCHEANEEHHHNTHNHNHDLHGDEHHDDNHQHFPHQNHLDEGLLGLISCLLGEADHPIDASSQRCLPGQQTTFSAKKPVLTLLFSWLAVQLPVDNPEQPAQFILDSTQSPPFCEFIGTVSHRGPPTSLA
jgi:hypothetical protein